MSKKCIKTAVAAVFCIAAMAHSAGVGVPMQNMSTYSLAAEYYTNVSGHEALYTNRDTSEAVWGHYMRLHYAPLPFLRLTAGIGGSRFYADPRIKGISGGTSPTFGVGLYSPRIADILTFTAGYNWTYVSAKHKDREELDSTTYVVRDPPPQQTDPDGVPIGEPGVPVIDTLDHTVFTRGGALTGSISTMNFGLILSAGRFVDFEAGVQLHSFTVSRNTTRHARTNFYNNHEGIDGGILREVLDTTYVTSEFRDSVADQTRLYAGVTLHDRTSGAYLNVGTAYNLDRIEGRGMALSNFSIWGSVGLIMRESQKVRSSDRDRRDHEEYLRLRNRQDKMMDVLILGIEHEAEEEAEGDE